MEPIETADSNIVLKHPDCLDLPAQYKDGIYTTVWKLTKEEIRQVKKTGLLALHIWGTEHPPVAFGMVVINKGEQND